MECLRTAWDTPTKTPIQKLVLARLADRASGPENTCWPGISSISKDCCLSESSVHRALKELAAMGFIKINSGGGAKPNTYVLPDTPVTQTPVSNRHPCQSDTGGVSNRQGRGVTQTPEGCLIDTRTQINPKRTPTNPKEMLGKPKIPIVELRARVGSLFQRDPQAPWGYDEEYALVAVAGREHVLAELAEIEAFWKSGDYLPQKLSRLLDGWTGVLDRARGIGRNNGHVKSGRPATVSELKTILGLKEEKAATLKAQFASEGALSTDWTDESRRQEFVALRKEIKELKGRIEKMPI